MNQKKLVGEYAANLVENHMTVGLGTGSTAKYMIEALAKRVQEEKLEIVCVSTSIETKNLAERLNLEIKQLSEIDKIDLTIDGADEISPTFQGIKGGGGALLYEKIVATNSDKNVWIVDHSKLVSYLGEFPLPVEVIPFGKELLFEKFKLKGYEPTYRLLEDGDLFITDSGNVIIDLNLNKIENPKEFGLELNNEAGVVEHGLFIDIVQKVIVGTDNGEVKVLETK